MAKLSLLAVREFDQVPCAQEIPSLSITASITAPSFASVSRAPLDLLCCIDISGSMAGSKLIMVQKTLEFLIQQLRDVDRLCLVTFSSDAAVPLTFMVMDKDGKKAAQGIVHGLEADSGTDLNAGLLSSFLAMCDRKDARSLSAILLLTDGESSTKTSSSTWSVYTNDYPIHSFGIGSGHHSNVLRDISHQGNGQYHYVSRKKEIAPFVGYVLGGLVTTVAKDIRLTLETVDDAALLKVYTPFAKKEENNAQKVTISIPDLVADEKKDILFNIKLHSLAQPDLNQQVIKIHLEYTQVLSSGTSNQQSGLIITIPRPGGDNAQLSSSAEEKEEILVQKARVETVDAFRTAHGLGSNNDLPKARACLADQMTEVKAVTPQITKSRNSILLMEGLVCDLQFSLERMQCDTDFKNEGAHSLIDFAEFNAHQRGIDKSLISSAVAASAAPSSPPSSDAGDGSIPAAPAPAPLVLRSRYSNTVQDLMQSAASAAAQGLQPSAPVLLPDQDKALLIIDGAFVVQGLKATLGLGLEKLSHLNFSALVSHLQKRFNCKFEDKSILWFDSSYIPRSANGKPRLSSTAADANHHIFHLQESLVKSIPSMQLLPVPNNRLDLAVVKSVIPLLFSHHTTPIQKVITIVDAELEDGMECLVKHTSSSSGKELIALSFGHAHWKNEEEKDNSCIYINLDKEMCAVLNAPPPLPTSPPPPPLPIVNEQVQVQVVEQVEPKRTRVQVRPAGAKNVAVVQTAEQKIASDTRQAISILWSNQQLSVIKQAMIYLDETTKSSIQCCELMMAEPRAVPALLKLVKSLNKSLPHVDLVKHAMNILAHLGAVPSIADEIWTSVAEGVSQADRQDCPTILVELLQRYRGQDVFSLVLEVLSGLCSDTTRAQAFAARTDLMKRLSNLHQPAEQSKKTPRSRPSSASSNKENVLPKNHWQGQSSGSRKSVSSPGSKMTRNYLEIWKDHSERAQALAAFFKNIGLPPVAY